MAFSVWMTMPFGYGLSEYMHYSNFKEHTSLFFTTLGPAYLLLQKFV